MNQTTLVEMKDASNDQSTECQTRVFPCRLRRARDQLQSKNDECSRIKEENSELDDEIKQIKESHQ